MLKSRRGNTVAIIVAAVLIVVLLAGVGVFVLKPKGKSKGAEDKGPTASLLLGEFVVNLADPGSMRYLKTNVVLEVSGTINSGGGHGGEGGADPKLRDAVIEVLSSKKLADLTAPGGKDQLRKDIMAAVNKRLEDAKVVDVYFNEFAMQ